MKELAPDVLNIGPCRPLSELLDALILQRKKEALDYKAYLARIVELTRKVSRPESHSSYPASINSPARRALFDNLDQDEALAVRVDEAIRGVKKDDWRGQKQKQKQKEVRGAIKAVLGDDDGLVDTIYKLAESQRDY